MKIYLLKVLIALEILLEMLQTPGSTWITETVDDLEHSTIKSLNEDYVKASGNITGKHHVITQIVKVNLHYKDPLLKRGFLVHFIVFGLF